MNFNGDGFNERTNYIHNSNDLNRLKKGESGNFDNSFAQMRVEERKGIVETTNQDKTFISQEVRGKRENFLIRNNNMNRVNTKPTINNPINDALNRNMFKR